MFSSIDDSLSIPCIFLTGAAFIMLIYHLLLYFQYRERIILKYCLYLLSIFIYLPIELYSKQADHRYDLFVSAFNILVILAYAYFMLETVNMWRARYRKLYFAWNIIVGFSLVYVGVILLVLLTGERGYVSVINGMGITARVLFITVAIWAVILLFPRLKHDLFITWIKWGALVYLACMALVMVTMLLTPDQRLFGLDSMQYVYLGTLADIFIFSIAMSIKVKEAFAKAAEVRDRLSKDLHDEIGATLSGVLLISELAERKLETGNTTEAKTYLERIINESKQMTDKMGEIVWATNPGNDSLEKLMLRVQSYGAGICPARNIQFHFQQPAIKEENFSSTMRNSLYLICKEAINNAVKYSGAQNIRLTLKRDFHHYQLVIEDDGQGFDMVAVTGGNGLKNMQTRADEAGVLFRIHSGKNLGTSVELLFT